MPSGPLPILFNDGPRIQDGVLPEVEGSSHRNIKESIQKSTSETLGLDA